MNYESESFRNGTKVEGRYPNYLKVGHNIDQFYPENGHAQLHTRIVTTPTHAKAMLETFQKNSSRSRKSRKKASGLSMRM